MDETEYNTTSVVFAIDSLPKQSISPAQMSLIRSSFVSLVTRSTDLLLNATLFGEPSFFEVLKFPGGITVSPQQTVYPLQKVQILFNFTLNYSILEIQENFEVLKNQLAMGLHLTSNEVRMSFLRADVFVFVFLSFSSSLRRQRYSFQSVWSLYPICE